MPKYPEMFYFIKDTQKGTTLRRVDSNDKVFFYVHMSNSTCSRFVRISKQEYDLIDQHHSVKKDCLTTYRKDGKLYQKQLAIELNEAYIEYFNDFLTVERFAAYKGWSLFFAKKVIESGQKINHDQALLNALYS